MSQRKEISTYWPCEGTKWDEFAAREKIPEGISLVELGLEMQALNDVTNTGSSFKKPTECYKAAQKFLARLDKYMIDFERDSGELIREVAAKMRKVDKSYVMDQLNVIMVKTKAIEELHGRVINAPSKFPKFFNELTEEIGSVTPDTAREFYNKKFRLIGMYLRNIANLSEERGDVEFATTARNTEKTLKGWGFNECNQLAQDSSNGPALLAKMRELLPKAAEECRKNELFGRERSKRVQTRPVTGDSNRAMVSSLDPRRMVMMNRNNMKRSAPVRGPIYWC